MTTNEDFPDNLTTVSFDPNLSECTRNLKRNFNVGAGGSDSILNANAVGCTNEKERNMPGFSPSFVKIPFEDIELGECCGEGSFGTVYMAKWSSQGKHVAVKTLNRMDEEVRILSTLSHRNIIQFYGACCEVPNCCLVTEYAPYGSLYGFLSSPKSENLEFAQMLTWAKDVAHGMNYLHEEAPIQVIHRDLKSKNVLICKDFCLKICDFGASRVFDETTVMTITGTYPWMAPELIQGLPTSELCDVYSFGVVLWELLTKEVPFKGLQGFQVAWNVVEKKERPVIPTTCPKCLCNLMQECWQAEASARPSFCDILLDLNQMLIDGDLEKEADSFVQTKGDWIVQVKDKLKDIRQQESKLEAEKNNVEIREEIMKKWAERLENELKQKSLFNFQFSTSFNCEYSERSKTSTSNVKEAVNRMMFSSGLHRHSSDEKFGIKMEASSPSTAASPFFGIPLSRQGSTSSMESSRSMSLHSDMTYDMSKVNMESSPVAFMDSTGNEPFPKVLDVQATGRSRMKLQKQMSASSEEFQYEGMKMSRESPQSNGDARNISERERASAKSIFNQMNESISKSSGNVIGTGSRSRCYRSDRTIVPSVDILEKALRSLDLKKLPAIDTSAIAAKLYDALETVLRDVKSSSSPSPTDELDSNEVQFGTISPTKSRPTKRSPPYIKNMPPLPVMQKPPINYSPTRVMDSDDLFMTVRQCPRRSMAKSVETQTDNLASTITRQDFGTQTANSNEKKFINSLHHVPSLERACTDAHKSGAREYITLRISRNSPLESFQPTVYETKKDLEETITDNSVDRKNMAANSVPAKSKMIDLVSRPSPPRSLSLDQTSPVKVGVCEIPRHIAARQVYLSGQACSAFEQRSDIHETDDFTYIIQPIRRRQRRKLPQHSTP